MSGAGNKRPRSENAKYGSKAAAVRRAYALRKKFPPKDYGIMYAPRGTPEGIAKFGATWKDANADQRAARNQYGWSGRGLYTGRGGYWGDLGDKLLGTKGLLSGAEDALANTSLGASWRKMTGQGLYTGRGAYTNATIGGHNEIPSFSPSSDGTRVSMSHKEYISDVYAGTGVQQLYFQNTTYSINPGIERTFPWLSQIAQNFEEYEIKQLMFTFRSTVTDFNSGTGQVGTVVMATQYNAGDQPFVDKETMMQYDLSMSGKVSGHMIHGVECDPSKLSGTPGKYVRAGPPPVGQDLKTYDLGTLNVATANIPAQFDSQSLGELWVSYTVELRKPKFFVNKGLGISRDVYVGRTATGGNVTQFSDMTVYSGQQNSIGTEFSVDPTHCKVVFPATFTGAVKVRLMLNTVDASVVNWAALQLSGNVHPIEDIYDTPGPTPWIWNQGNAPTGASVSGTHNGCIFEFHVYVGNPTQITPVVDNGFTVSALITSGGFQGLQIDIEEYNTRFNVSPPDTTGRPDSIVLIDQAGQVVNV